MIFRELRKAWSLLRALPKSLYFNFRYLEPGQAIRLPVLVSHHVTLDLVRGRVVIDKPRSGTIRIGFDTTNLFDEAAKSVWQVTGTVRFKGRARIGPQAKFVVSGELVIGDNFDAGSDVALFCAERVEFGDNNLLSWGITVMDNDFHPISDAAGQVVNPPAPVVLGNEVWIGCDATLLKGSGCGDGCVIAAGTLLHKRLPGDNQVIGGTPPRVLRQDIRWRR